MAPESMWPGMFQAEAGAGNTASMRSTRDAISDTAAAMPYPINKGGEKRFWTMLCSTLQVSFFTPPGICLNPPFESLLSEPMCLVLKLLRNIRPGFQFLGWHNGCATFGGI